MRRLHEAGPDFDRQAAAGRLFGRRVVVIAEPDAGDEIGGVADEPGVAEILAGAGLAGGRSSPESRPCCAVPESSVSCIMVFIIATWRGSITWPSWSACRAYSTLPSVSADPRHDMGRDAEAAIGERRIGADQFESARLPRCRARSRHWRRASRRCRADARCAPRSWRRLPVPSRTATVLSDIASACVSVTAPKYSWL